MGKRIEEPQIGKGYYSVDGVLFNSCDRVVAPDICWDKGWPVTAVQRAAYTEYCDRVCAEYRASQARHGEIDGEMAYEMEAAFGPGQTVVDMITGKTYHT